MTSTEIEQALSVFKDGSKVYTVPEMNAASDKIWRALKALGYVETFDIEHAGVHTVILTAEGAKKMNKQ